MRVKIGCNAEDYAAFPIPIMIRLGWEFHACLTGEVAATLPDAEDDGGLRSRTLWAFPPGRAHGWSAEAPCERAVFHFTEVPGKLEELLPPRGYYRVPLSAVDCERLRLLAKTAMAMDVKPTQLLPLHDSGLLIELSMMALREVTPGPLTSPQQARRKADQALAWYEHHMADDPAFEEIARAVNLSAPHLRRLFHKAHGERPHTLLHRLRMQHVEELLLVGDLTLEEIAARVGYSDSSALSRAVKKHFHRTPTQLRQLKRHLAGGTSTSYAYATASQAPKPQLRQTPSEKGFGWECSVFGVQCSGAARALTVCWGRIPAGRGL